MEFTDRHEAYRQQVEAALDAWLPPAAARPARIHEAMRYSVDAGGKRLRPVLVLACAELYHQRVDALPAAVAIELLHTYTLIHDDLPCMDDSDLRRGRPSAHVKFDQATAVLAGDALLTEAFSILSRAYVDEPSVGLRLVRLLSEAGDSRRLIGGQVLDTLAEQQEIGPEELDYIHLNKTAALLRAALRMGLACTDAPVDADAKADQIGRHLGLVFQIVDDILDATSNPEVLGKTTGADVNNQKNTYVRVHGLEASRERAAELTREALRLCADWDADTWFLEELIRQLEHRLA
ncbi:MAG: geranylgeranyl diphosphate synthase type II [Puniceicoccaceae bacterium 5H]|nr:MAG: geranylgeranyl diphosphate synthase type II [Puniceicoccaceae bacterium 5H]